MMDYDPYYSMTLMMTSMMMMTTISVVHGYYLQYSYLLVLITFVNVDMFHTMLLCHLSIMFFGIAGTVSVTT